MGGVELIEVVVVQKILLAGSIFAAGYIVADMRRRSERTFMRALHFYEIKKTEASYCDAARHFGFDPSSKEYVKVTDDAEDKYEKKHQRPDWLKMDLD